MVVYNRTASGGWSSSPTGQSPSSLGYSGARSSSSASSASQASGGQASQNNAVASTGNKNYEYTKSDGSKGTTTDYRHSDAAKAADAANRNSASTTPSESSKSSGGGSGGGGGGGGNNQPTVVYKTPYIPETKSTPQVTNVEKQYPDGSGGGGGGGGNNQPTVVYKTPYIPETKSTPQVTNVEKQYPDGGAGGNTYKLTYDDGTTNTIAVSGISLEDASKYYADKAARAQTNGDYEKNVKSANEFAKIAESQSSGNNAIGKAANPTKSGDIQMVNLPGTDIKVSTAEWNEMHPIQTPEIVGLSGNAQIRIESQNKQQEKASAGNSYGAYKDSVTDKKAQSAIEAATLKTINPNAEKVTLTESLRTDPIIGNSFTFAQTALFDAEGKYDPLPLIGNREDINAAYTKRLQEYEAKENGNTGRLEQSMSGALEVATLPLNFVGGFGTGAAIGTAGKGLAKLTSTKVGGAITNAVTKPWVSNEVLVKSAVKASYGIKDATNKVVNVYDKLPEAIQREVYLIGRDTISLKGLSTLGVSALAGASGVDAASAGIAKKTADVLLKTKALIKGGAAEKAYRIYSSPLISEANFKALSDGIITGTTKIIKVERVTENKFPKAYKAATILKNAFSTPGAAAMNTLQLAYLGDAGYRIATSDDKLKTAAQVAVEIPAGFIGAKYGLQAIDKASSYLATRGRQYIPIERIGYAEGIPLGKRMTDATLEASFDLNTPIPKPYRFGRTEKQNQPTPKQARIESSNKFDPDTGINYDEAYPNQVWHATPQGERLGSKIIVGDSTSELPGIYTSEVGVGYYLHLEQKNNIKPALLISKSNAQYTPKFAVFRVTGVEGIPVKGRAAQTEFLRESADVTKAYAPNMKEEYEALLPPGAGFVKTGKGYYTVINGNRVPIDEYAPNLDVGLEYLKLGVTNYKYNLNLSPEMRIRTTELYANENLIKGVNKSKFKVYKQSTAYSSYGKASGKQLPLGGTSYAGSKAIRSLSAAGSSAKQTPSYSVGLFSEISLPSFGTPTGSKVRGSSTNRPSATSAPKTPSAPKAPSEPKIPSISIPTGTNKPIIPSILSPGKRGKSTAQLKRKREDKRGADIDLYSAARRGRIDHLSIVDPLEFLGKGSLTNRKRADMTLYKQKIYLVDNDISLTKPTGRRRK